MKILVDHNLSPKLARSLNAIFEGKHEIIALKEKFPITVTDVEWMTALNKEGNWVVLSGDRKITRNAAEKAVFRSSKMIGFFMAQSLFRDKPHIQLARILLIWQKIENIVSSVSDGGTYELTQTKIKML